LWNGVGVASSPCPRLSCDFVSLGTLVTVAADEARTGIDIELVPGSRITGNITIDGSLQAGFEVDFYAPNGRYAGFAVSDESGVDQDRNTDFIGTMYLDNSPDGFDCGFTICVVTSGSPIVTDGSIDVAMNTYNYVTPLPGTISGSALNTNGESPGGAVVLYHQNGNWFDQFWFDENGNFETYPIPTGIYYAITKYTYHTIDDIWDDIDGLPCPNQLCNPVDGAQIYVASGQAVTNINFLLDPIITGGTISGHVIDTAGNALSNVAIVVTNSAGNYLVETNTDQNGNYQTNLLTDGEYHISTSNEPLGYGRELFNWPRGIDPAPTYADGNVLCLPSSQCDDPNFIVANGNSIGVYGY